MIRQTIPRASRLAMRLAAFAALAYASSCTTYRILRYRDPDPRNQRMFPTRTVRKADVPFQFARLTTLRTDLDTVSVRLPDGPRVPFAQYMADRSILAFVVIRHDTIVYERYRGGLTDSSIHSSFSMAKSVLSSLVGIAIGEGAIKSLDQQVTEFLPALRDKPAFQGVTLRHLLGMRSGLRYRRTGNGIWSDFRSEEAHMYYAADTRNAVESAQREFPPGAKWAYKDTDAELLGMVLAAATGKTVAAYAEEHLWRRIGTEHDATWNLDHDGGQEKTASGLNATARDFARFGRLFLHGGAWQGVQVVPAEWVAASAAVDTTRTEPENSTWYKMQHTLFWWHAIQAPAGDFFADGSHGQRIYIDPASETIIVQLATDSRQDFPFRKIVAYLNGSSWEYPRSIPGTVNQAAQRFGADSVRPVFNRLIAEAARSPEQYVITESSMNAVARSLAAADATLPSGVALYTIITERYPRSRDGFVGLSNALRKAGNAVAADSAMARAPGVAPNRP